MGEFDDDLVRSLTDLVSQLLLAEKGLVRAQEKVSTATEDWIAAEARLGEAKEEMAKAQGLFAQVSDEVTTRTGEMR